MITGEVSADNEAVIPIKAYDADGHIVELKATIDTGFAGYLTLPATTIALLRLQHDRTETYTLGDNRDVEFDVYRATLSWDGQNRRVLVLSTESDPLIGMKILRGYVLSIDIIDGGTVHITART